MSLVDRLNSTALVGAVLSEASKLSDRSDADIDEHQFYIQKVGFYLAHALTWHKQLGVATELMMNFDYAKRIDASRGEHLVFSIENYLIRLSSVYDRVLQLVNVVFHLGVNEEHVSHAVIVSNYKVQHRPELVRRVKAVKKYLDEYAQTRHTLIHRHSLLDAKLRRIELFYLHDVKVLYPDSEKSKRFKTFRANYLREYAVEKKKEFAEVNERLTSLLESLFSELLKEFHLQREAFRQRGL